MATAFVGFKQVDGFFTGAVAERDYRDYIAKLIAQDIAFTTEEFGDDYTTIYVVDTFGTVYSDSYAKGGSR
jgi:hypothetical protein